MSTGETPVLRGERVVLRPGTIADAPAMFAIVDSPATSPWWHDYTLERGEEDLTWPDGTWRASLLMDLLPDELA